MYKLHLKFQRIICILLLITCALTFVYSLGMMTDLYDTHFLAYDKTLAIDDPNYFGLFKGAYLYFEMQPFNQSLFYVTIVLLLVCLTLFVTNSQSRRKYYISNYVSIGLTTVATFGVSIWAISQIIFFRTKFLTQTDFATMKAMADLVPNVYSYSESTFWFDIGIVIFVLTMLLTVLLIANMIIKIVLMNKEKTLLSSNKKEATV